MIRTLKIVSTLALFMVVACWAQVDVFSPTHTELKILSSNASELIVEIDVPDLHIIKSTIKGVHGVSLGLDGYSSTHEPGRPMLPLRGIPIALPPHANPSLRILNMEEKTEPIGNIIPAPAFANASQNPENESVLQYERNEIAYRSNQFSPRANIQIGTPRVMRDLDIVSVLFYPVRYNPVSQNIKRVTKIRFAVDFNLSPQIENSVTFDNSTAFKTLFSKTLINYDQAKRWSRSQARLEKNSYYFLEDGKEWFKIHTDKAGLYKINFSDLKDAGFDADVDLQNVRLFNQGKEVAIRIITNDDGLLDENDYFEFYAQALKNNYTTTNVYWLTVSENSGTRMHEVDGTPSQNVPLLSFGKNRLHLEKDFFHIANFPGHTNQDHWFMDSLFAPTAQSYHVDLGQIVREENLNAELTIKMLGYAANINVNPDHHTLVEINGEQIYEKYWDGRIGFTESVKFLNSLLKDGLNEIKIIAPGDTDNPYLDWQLIDFIKLDYSQKNSVTKDSLNVVTTKNGNYAVQGKGFSENVISVYDIKNPYDPVFVNGIAREGDQLLFEYAISSSEFLLLSEDYKNHPLKIEKDDNSNWRDRTNSADYIIITFDEFFLDAAPLASFHEANGLAVQIVKVRDVYDEFGYGIYAKEPIKEFLSYAYHNWATRPEFVLLLGDASWNPRRLRPELERYGSGALTDFVPTHLFEADVDHAQATSDSWFACFDGVDDVLPDMMVGRLPARSRIEAQYMVQKILNYATRFEPGAWNNTATFVADIGEGGTNAFEDSSDSYIQKYIPEDFTANRIYLADHGMPLTRDEISRAFGQGCLTLNYFGHGAVGLWASQHIFSNEDVPNLEENIHLPFVFTMSCINGYFADPSISASAMGEILISAENKGAIAVFTGSGKAYASTLHPLTNNLYYTLYTETNPVVGAFTNAGLLNMHATYPASTDHVRFYMLFGDPATRLHYTHAGASKQYAWFSGNINYKGERPPGKSLLAAFINERQFSSGLINSDGEFGPIYVPQDNSSTPDKDGGVAGDSVNFELIVPNDSSHVLKPKVPWHLGETANINLYVKANSVAQDVSVEFFVDHYKVGEQFYDGDPIGLSSTIYAEIKRTNPSPTISDFDISLNTRKLSDQDIQISSYNPSAHKTILSFSPQNLQDGEYELNVRAIDNTFQNEGNSFRFTISSTLKLYKVVNYPNPFSGLTKFTFMLNNDSAAEVSVKIYTVAGRLVHKINSYADVGYNEIPWDGRDSYGDQLANGVYFYKISANDGEEQTELIERLVVMH